MPEHEKARQRRFQAHGESYPVHFAQAPAFASSLEATMPGDSNLQQDVLAELAWESSVDHADRARWSSAPSKTGFARKPPTPAR
jgi:hypothetical protein